MNTKYNQLREWLHQAGYMYLNDIKAGESIIYIYAPPKGKQALIVQVWNDGDSFTYYEETTLSSMECIEQYIKR